MQAALIAAAPGAERQVHQRVPAVVIASRPGFFARLQIRSPIFRIIRASGAPVIVLWPDRAIPQLERELADSSISIGPLGRRPDGGSLGSLLERWLLRGRMYVCPTGGPSGGQAGKLLIASRAADSVRRRLWWGSIRAGVWALNHSSRLRRAALRLEERVARTDFYSSLFERERPGVVVTATPGFSAWHEDAYVIREARRAGIPTICIVPSWDHPTAKGMFGATPDHFLVWSAQQREHLSQVHGVDINRVHVVGNPLFDMYLARRDVDHRSELRRQYRLDPARKTILLGLNSPRVYPQNVELASMLVRAMQQGRFSHPVQMIIRPHPVTFVDKSHPDVARLAALADASPHVHLSVPSVVGPDVFDVPWGEMEEVVRLISGSDVVVNLFSTLQLEAAVADTPVVSAAFDPRDVRSRERSLVDIRDYEYHSRLHQTGGVRCARSPEELVQQIDDYLGDGARDRAGRAALVSRECGPLDGRSAERIADFILAVATRRRPGQAADPATGTHVQ